MVEREQKSRREGIPSSIAVSVLGFVGGMVLMNGAVRTSLVR
jgi:hypothetical protein